MKRGPVTDTFIWMTGEEELAKKHEKSILRGRRKLKSVSLQAKEGGQQH